MSAALISAYSAPVSSDRTVFALPAVAMLFFIIPPGMWSYPNLTHAQSGLTPFDGIGIPAGSGADAGIGPVPTEQLAELPTNRPQRSAGKRTAGRVTRREALNEPMEVARAAGRRKRPHVLEAKIVRELVDSPWPRGLRAVRESHRRTSNSSRELTLTGIVASGY